MLLVEPPPPPIPRATPPIDSLSRRAGGGIIEIEQVNGRSAVTRLRAHSPLRLLTPSHVGDRTAWIYTSTFGGGLLAGDEVNVSLRVGAGATVLLATQASTKVYRGARTRPARQNLSAVVERGAALFLLPDPLTCYAGAVFEQQLIITLAGGASLILLDWLTSGRRARGERWAFERCGSKISVSVAGAVVFRDALLLDSTHGPLIQPGRMGLCDCYGSLLVLGPRFADASAEILAFAAGHSIRPTEGVWFSASPLAGGAVVRFAGSSTQQVERWLRRRLHLAPALLGGDPWRSKGPA